MTNTEIPHTKRGRSAWRWVLLGLSQLAFLIYLGSYIRLRQHHELIHAWSYDGDGSYHSIRPGESGPFLFAAAAMTGQLDQLNTIGAAQQRRENFRMAFYAPARYAEVLYWHMRY
jgi:hypothetical protein